MTKHFDDWYTAGVWNDSILDDSSSATDSGPRGKLVFCKLEFVDRLMDVDAATLDQILDGEFVLCSHRG